MRPYPALFAVLVLLSAPALRADSIPSDAVPIHRIPKNAAEPMATGPFEPTWQSLAHYRVPQWFRDAKFGIWAHWGPQCEPEQGDWYARLMYVQGDPKNVWHVAHYGPPSKSGFKDVIHSWHAEHWDPDKLVALYQRAGAQYFFALANHHDNFDLWDSRYQPWNSVRVGPHKDLIAGWEKAAWKYGLKFGVSIHAAHAWSWYEVAQGADKTGPLAGVPYDGKLTKADGRGQWWDGLDPQDLYAQNHTPSPNFQDPTSLYSRWNWDNGVSLPDAAYCEKFYNRTLDLINRYHPDLIYFDDTALPLWPVSDAGLKIAAHYYNTSMKLNHGNLECVLFGKNLAPDQMHCMTLDIERGHSNAIEPEPWQSDTCLGDWHYKRSIYEQHKYKTAATVIHILADVVSKNGNLLLNVPVRGDGTIDDDEVAVVQGIARWMDVNREAIFGTRPWKVFGEGPATEQPSTGGGFNEGKGRPFTAEDVRFTARGNTVYAITLGVPTGPVTIKSLGRGAKLIERRIARVELLGYKGALTWKSTAAGLTIDPVSPAPCDCAFVYRIAFE